MEFLTCLCPFLIIAVLASIIYFASDNKQKKNPVLNKVLLLTWLGQMKSKGYSTIDELINLLNGKTVSGKRSKKLSTSKTIKESTKEFVKTKYLNPQPVKPYSLIFLALGLVLFVLFIFISLNSLIAASLGIFLSFEKFFVTMIMLSVSGYLFKLIYAEKRNLVERFFNLTGIVFSQLFNIIAILAALSNVDTIYNSHICLVVSAAIIGLPTLNLIQIFVGRITKESYLVIALIPFQLLAFCVINKVMFGNTIIIFTIYSVIKILASEYYLKKGHFKLHVLSQIIFWTMVVFTTFFTTTAVIGEFGFKISKLVVMFVYIINLLSLNLPAIIYKRYEVLAITINYLILVVFRLMSLMYVVENISVYFTIAVLLHIGGLALHFWFTHKGKRKDMTFVPYVILSAVAVLLTVLNTTPLFMILGFGVIIVTSIVFTNFTNKGPNK